MRRKLGKILILLTIFIVILFALKFTIKKVYKVDEMSDTETSNIETNEEIVVKNVGEKEVEDNIKSTCPVPDNEYENMWLLNIGKEIGLDNQNYIPKDLVEVSKKYSTKTICLTKVTQDAFEEMAKYAKKDGYTIKVSSGFRSYTYQKNLFGNAVKNGSKDVDISIAKAGHSEHQLGTTADITSASINYDSASGNFYKTPESEWLKKNAYLYGFVQSYPLGKEDITGYKSEPWHYRYVGLDNAKAIKDSGLTIIEFLNK